MGGICAKRKTLSENVLQEPTLLTNRTRLSLKMPPKSAGSKRLSVNGKLAASTTREACQLTQKQLMILQQDDIVLLQGVCALDQQKRCSRHSSDLDSNVAKSFQVKKTRTTGARFNWELHGVGFACTKGLKPGTQNQDSWCMMKAGDEFSFYGVFDGHGEAGHHISNLAMDVLPKFVLQDARFKTDLKTTLIDAFTNTHALIGNFSKAEGFDSEYSGTTGTFVVHDRRAGKLTVAHVGDSGCCLGQWGENSKETRGKPLTEDHKPENACEKGRIEAAGGRVEHDGYANHRVYRGDSDAPGMNMSRALGDSCGHDCGISAEPDVSVHILTSNDKVLLLCSDGVWEFMEPAEVVATVAVQPPQRGAEVLAKAARSRWMKHEKGQVVDDITALVIKLPPLPAGTS